MSETRIERRSKPPPNYSSRSNQLRLLLMVSLLMLVLVVMERARDPKNYRWLFGPEAGEALEPSDDSERLPPGIRRLDVDARNAAQGPSDIPDDPHAQRLDAARRDAWSQAIGQLSETQCKQLTEQLRRLRRNEGASGEPPAEWPEIVETLDHAWRDYLAQAESTVLSRGGEADTDAWRAVVEQLQLYWNDAALPALQRSHANSLDADEGTSRRIFEDLQLELDRRAWEHVRDNTVFRAAEHEAWLRVVERLLDEAPVSAPAVSYLQLVDHPNNYRGQPVRVAGVVRWGYRSVASANDLGIDTYYVLWIKPADGSNAPIAVYCLELPDGFPPLADRQQSGEVTQLDEPVEVTGIFFKRLAYAAEGGVSIAPLLIARGPKWFPERTEDTPAFSPTDLSIGIVAGIVLGLLGLLASLHAVRKATHSGRAPPDAVEVSEALRQLEQQKQHE